MRIFFILFLLFHWVFGYSQNIGIQVRPDHKKTLTVQQLQEVTSINDIDNTLPYSWIDKIVEVRINMISNGDSLNIKNSSDTLTKDQLQKIKNADLWSDIAVEISYIPKNDLLSQEERVIKFMRTIVAESEAQYATGTEAMDEYLQDMIVEKINEYKGFELMTLSFYVSEKGNIQHTEITKSSGDELLDDFINESISNMPLWIPAKTSSGMNVHQKFVLYIGQRIGC